MNDFNMKKNYILNFIRAGTSLYEACLLLGLNDEETLSDSHNGQSQTTSVTSEVSEDQIPRG